MIFSSFRQYIENKKWWDSEMEEEWKRDSRQQILAAFSKAEKELKPPIKDMFSDVYDNLPYRLQKQQLECMNHVVKYPEEYPTELHVKDE